MSSGQEAGIELQHLELYTDSNTMLNYCSGTYNRDQVIFIQMLPPAVAKTVLRCSSCALSVRRKKEEDFAIDMLWGVECTGFSRGACSVTCRAGCAPHILQRSEPVPRSL